MTRILVVDDSDAIHLLLQHILTEHGYEVVTAESAQQAVHAIIKQKPDLILLDVHLPDIGGVQLCELLRRQTATKSVPIIMITGTAITGKEKASGLQAGADDYVTKPFEPDELVERIRAVLRRSEAKAPPIETVSPAVPDYDRTAEPVTAPDSASSPHETLTVHQAFVDTLCAPGRLSGELPPVALLFLVILITFSALGVVVTSDLAVRPFAVCSLAVFLWGFLIAVLVVASSLCGVTLPWKQGSRLLSLASLPILLKLLGGIVLAAITSLSPFLYSAGPALAVPLPSFWLYRVDLYEVWAVALLWVLLKNRPRATAGKAAAITALVWSAGGFFLFCMQQLQGKL